MKNEPALTVGGITAGTTAVLALLVAFGVPLSHDQKAAILSVVGVAAPLVSAYLTRRKVTPVKPAPVVAPAPAPEPPTPPAAQ